MLLVAHRLDLFTLTCIPRYADGATAYVAGLYAPWQSNQLSFNVFS